MISACLVTRGDVDLTPILWSLPPQWEAIIWNNRFEDEDLAVYGRYAAISRARFDRIYVQDDDCVLPRESLFALAAEYEPGVLTANMPQEFRRNYPDSCLLGFGSIFDRSLPQQAFARYQAAYPGVPNEDKRLRCDVIFTALTPRKLVDLPVEILAYAYGDDRMFKTRGHAEERERVLEAARKVPR